LTDLGPDFGPPDASSRSRPRWRLPRTAARRPRGPGQRHVPADGLTRAVWSPPCSSLPGAGRVEPSMR
jgi:hypothetical protein